MNGFDVAAVVWMIPAIVLLTVLFRRMVAASRKQAARACAAGIGAVIVVAASALAISGLLREQPSVTMVAVGVGGAVCGFYVGTVYWRSVR